MYAMPDYFLVRNPIDRYSVGDRTPGLAHGDDGFLTITIQHDEPVDASERANWLPAPEGDFRPALRVYYPRPEVRRTLRTAAGRKEGLGAANPLPSLSRMCPR
jgi:hypothetical protein